MKKSFKFIKVLITYLLLLVFSNGCVDEQMSICELYLKFSYTYNMQHTELFHKQVEQVRVYFYNKNNEFIGMEGESDPAKLTDPNYLMLVPFSYSNDIDNAVVWAGKTEDSYYLPTPKKGDNLNKLFIELNILGQNSSNNLSSLWHGKVGNLFFDLGRKVETVDLVRSTNHIRFTINGKPLADSLIVKVISDNGKYDYNHSVVPIKDIHYFSHSVVENANEITTLRFLENLPINLSVLNKTTQQPIIDINGGKQIDIISYVLKNKPTTMTNQEYLDREYIWNIDLKVDEKFGNYIAVAITINGWTTWFNNVDLE